MENPIYTVYIDYPTEANLQTVAGEEGSSCSVKPQPLLSFGQSSLFVLSDVAFPCPLPLKVSVFTSVGQPYTDIL